MIFMTQNEDFFLNQQNITIQPLIYDAKKQRNKILIRLFVNN